MYTCARVCVCEHAYLSPVTRRTGMYMRAVRACVRTYVSCVRKGVGERVDVHEAVTSILIIYQRYGTRSSFSRFRERNSRLM